MIRDIEIKSNGKGRIQSIRIVFGPHYFLDVVQEKDKVSFAVGYTHHGFKADASKVDSELEQIIEEIRRSHPDKAID
jgi:hypothetical protein